VGSAGGPACAPLPGAFPAGLAFIPGLPGRLLVANFAPGAALPFDGRTRPPVVASPGAVPGIPADSDGDGRDEGCAPPACATPLVPLLDGVLGVRANLALVTASGYEEVLFVDPGSGGLVPLEVSTPAALDPGDFPFLPPPGSSAPRTALSTQACVPFSPGAVDSAGMPVLSSPRCVAGRINTRFTSGVALAAGHLFVSTSNVDKDPGGIATTYLPGSILVYDLDLNASPPRVHPHSPFFAIETLGFNPTHVTRVVTPGGRELVLVSVSGALGIVPDDPSTPELEGGGVARSEAAIEVIDPQSLQLVATVPLGLAGLSFDRLAVDPGGRVAFAGSAIGRHLLGIDLSALDALPPAPAPPLVLDGSDPAAGHADARIFDADRPLVLPRRPDGPSAGSCPGFTVGVAFDAAGSTLFATDFCDGTISVVAADLSAGPTPLPRSRFQVLRATPVAAPLGAAGLGGSRAPGSLAVRPGLPQVDFDGPDLFFLLGDPEGQLCSVASAGL